MESSFVRGGVGHLTTFRQRMRVLDSDLRLVYTVSARLVKAAHSGGFSMGRLFSGSKLVAVAMAFATVLGVCSVIGGPGAAAANGAGHQR